MLSNLLLITCATAALSQPQGAAQEAVQEADWIPIELIQEAYVFVPAKLNGIEVQAMFDSGAGMTCVSRDFARQLGLQGGQLAQASGVGGSVEARIHSGVNLVVGASELRDIRVVELELSDVAIGLGHAVPLVLGRQVLEQTIVDLDYPGRRMAFRDPKSFHYKGQGTTLKLKRSYDGLRSVQLNIEAGPAEAFVVDTGSGGALLIQGAGERLDDLLKGRQSYSTGLAGGVGGRDEIRLLTLDSIRLAGVTLRKVPTAIMASSITQASAGILGSQVLCRFRVIFNAPGSQLILEPASDASERSFRRDRFGLQFQVSASALEVLHVSAGSPAAASWKAGARIVQIDGEPIAADYWQATYLWRFREPGQTVRLTDSEGQEHILVAADYY